MKRISDETMISDLIRVAELLDKKVVTSTDYSKNGNFSLPTITERFGTWATFVSKACLEPTGHLRNVGTDELFLEIERIWTTLGKQPTTTDMKKGISRYSLETFTRRFGGWRSALSAFIEYVNTEVDEAINADEPSPSHQAQKSNPVASKTRVSTKRTPRSINVKLRFTVLQSDSFRCRSCGASPAKSPEIELHVDHIVPWSKGGETEVQNLQTLCSKCNLGKSNHEFISQSASASFL